MRTLPGSNFGYENRTVMCIAIYIYISYLLTEYNKLQQTDYVNTISYDTKENAKCKMYYKISGKPI